MLTGSLLITRSNSLARERVITDPADVVQINRALPRGRRVTENSKAELNRLLAKKKRTVVVADTTNLVSINKALEGAR